MTTPMIVNVVFYTYLVSPNVISWVSIFVCEEKKSRCIGETNHTDFLLRRYYTGSFMSCGYKCRRWFPRSLWSKAYLLTWVLSSGLWCYGNSLILINTPPQTTLHTFWNMLYATWPWTLCFCHWKVGNVSTLQACL
jgi:hypothetical protein